MRLVRGFCLLLTALSLLAVHGAESAPGGAPLQLHARLVWGTDDSKPPKPDVTDLDAKLQTKLRGVFKWKNYFQCKTENVAVPTSGNKRVKLSNQCEIEIENQGGAWVEVKLYGEGKLLVKKRQAITPGEHLILAGDGKNDTAWFVVLSMPAANGKP